MAHDLHVYNQAFNLPAMCGEEAVPCVPGMPTFSVLKLQGSPATPTAETLGVQGLPQMMNAEQYVVDHHLAQVISPSLAPRRSPLVVPSRC